MDKPEPKKRGDHITHVAVAQPPLKNQTFKISIKNNLV